MCPIIAAQKMGMKVFIRSQYTTLPPLIAGPQMSKRIRMKRRKTSKTIMSLNVFSLCKSWSTQLLISRTWNGNRWFQNDRENKRSYRENLTKKYKPLMMENVYIHHLYLCVQWQNEREQKVSLYFFRMGSMFNKPMSYSFKSQNILWTTRLKQNWA